MLFSTYGSLANLSFCSLQILDAMKKNYMEHDGGLRGWGGGGGWFPVPRVPSQIGEHLIRACFLGKSGKKSLPLPWRRGNPGNRVGSDRDALMVDRVDKIRDFGVSCPAQITGFIDTGGRTDSHSNAYPAFKGPPFLKEVMRTGKPQLKMNCLKLDSVRKLSSLTESLYTVPETKRCLTI
ncbi:hypothetical protein CDAR_225891 [Caerostris darwini]|uniref:Uncharacterized protein n=1 Tax=Caerostris darwini TaxID=1538125 RepID=A0AAV4M5K9_9ARAC|nr:hypothetical protein CDAR_225891 [Caerostris darwini]